jgi:beta-glucosidase
MNFSRDDFGPDFVWGVSSAAYQIEGAWNIDGKGKSIWDVFSNTRGKISKNQNGNIACDFYRRYPEDLSILSQLRIPNYRISLSWSRIMPSGTNTINQVGVDYYHRLIDMCLDLGIEPWITLYHWDLPYDIERKGGWTNRDIIGWFSDYTECCIKLFGNKVRHWIILNEPLVFTGAGYFLGIHAPGRKGLNSFLAAIHHAAMCQAEGGRVVRSLLPEALIGTTFSCSLVEQQKNNIHDLLAAKRVDALLNRMFIEPLAGLGYPVTDLKMLRRLEPFIKEGDEAKLAFDMDFIGLQNYTREIVTRSRITPFIWARVIKAEKRKVIMTEMKWEVYPESIYKMLKQFSKYTNFKKIIVTESGAAFHDEIQNERVFDEKRRNYIEQCIGQVLRAKREGVSVEGYFIWCFTDNFEWAEGFNPRFGLVYIDFESQRRIIKESGYWYSRFLQKSEQLV